MGRSRLFLIIRELITRIFQDNVTRSAAELAYYLLFSLFPLLIFVNALIGVFQFDINALLEELEVLLPSEVMNIIVDYVGYTASLRSQTLVYAGVVLGVWSISRSVSSLLRAISQAYRVQRRGWLSRVLRVILTVALMVSVFLLLILLMISQTLLATVSRFIHLPGALIALWDLIKFLIGPAFIFFLLTGLYHVASQRQYRLTEAMPGALFSCVVWTAFSMGFSYYVSNFGRYSILYGSLGAIIILMLWLYATGVLVITGGELNHVLIEVKGKKQGGTKNEQENHRGSGL